MKNYFKALFLFLLVSSCSPEETVILGSLSTPVQPAGSGEVAWITQTNSDVVQLVAVPFEYYAFIGWLEGNQTKPLNTENSFFLQRDESNKVVTALFELKDTDGDGVTDDIDSCPDTPNGEAPNANGCAPSQLDSDDDGVNDRDDDCPNTNAGEDVDNNGCADYQVDTDGDLVMDDMDICPDTILLQGETADDNGCAAYQRDTDDDGVMDDKDQCPNTPSDLIGFVNENGCHDVDGDGVIDDNDACLNTPEGEEVDEKGCAMSQKTYVPDNNFEQYLIDQGWDNVLDDYVITAKIENLQELDELVQDISDFTGIEDFTSLEELQIVNNDNIQSLDLTSNNNLDYLWVQNNEALETVILGEHKLTTLYIRNNGALQTFDLGINTTPNKLRIDFERNSGPLLRLDLTSLSNLNNLRVNENSVIKNVVLDEHKLESAEFYYNVNLEELDMGESTTSAPLELEINENENLDQVDLTGLGNLDDFTYELNNLEDLDLIYNNNLRILNVNSNSNLSWITLGQHKLQDVDIIDNRVLEELDMGQSTTSAPLNFYMENNGNNSPNSLDLTLTGLGNLDYLEIWNNHDIETITLGQHKLRNNIYINDNDALETLDMGDSNTSFRLRAYSNALKNVDVSGTTGLTELLLQDQNSPGLPVLENLDLSQNTALIYLNVNNNAIANIDLTKNTALESLHIYRQKSTSGVANHLTSLDLSKNTALRNLYIGSNGLESLDTSKNLLLRDLQAPSNAFVSLDFSNNTALEKLNIQGQGYLSGGGLTSLTLGNNTVLDYLQVAQNNLTTLDVSQNTGLIYIYCQNNRLVNLDVRSNSALTKLSASGQYYSDGLGGFIDTFECLQANNTQLINLSTLDWSYDVAPTLTCD